MTDEEIADRVRVLQGKLRRALSDMDAALSIEDFARGLVADVRNAAFEEAAQRADDFDGWVWCKCSECKTDASSHAVETSTSMQALAADIRTLNKSVAEIAQK